VKVAAKKTTKGAKSAKWKLSVTDARTVEGHILRTRHSSWVANYETLGVVLPGWVIRMDDEIRQPLALIAETTGGIKVNGRSPMLAALAQLMAATPELYLGCWLARMHMDGAWEDTEATRRPVVEHLRNVLIKATSGKPAACSAELIVWHNPRKEMPDSDCTVLLELGDVSGDPVWPGYHDGETWRTAEGTALKKREVSAWAHMPAGRARAKKSAEVTA
jgi:hypothetical protein